MSCRRGRRKTRASSFRRRAWRTTRRTEMTLTSRCKSSRAFTNLLVVSRKIMVLPRCVSWNPTEARLECSRKVQWGMSNSTSSKDWATWRRFPASRTFPWTRARDVKLRARRRETIRTATKTSRTTRTAMNSKLRTKFHTRRRAREVHQKTRTSSRTGPSVRRCQRCRGRTCTTLGNRSRASPTCSLAMSPFRRT